MHDSDYDLEKAWDFPPEQKKINLKSFLFCRLGFRFHLASSLLLVLHAFPFQYFSIPFFILCFCLGLFAFVLSYAFFSVVDSETAFYVAHLCWRFYVSILFLWAKHYADGVNLRSVRCWSFFMRLFCSNSGLFFVMQLTPKTITYLAQINKLTPERENIVCLCRRWYGWRN